MDVSKLVESFLGSQGAANPGKSTGGQSGLPSGLVGGAAAGGLIALLAGNKKARKLGGKAIKYGGMAAVAGLAYKAYNDWQTQKPSGTEPSPMALPKPAPDSGFDVENDHDATGHDLRLGLMRAMISAANCDNHIDAEEHKRIRAQVDALGLGAEEKAMLYEYFAQPSDPAAIAALARTNEQKAEIYLASCLSIDPDTAEEQSYLKALADHMALPQGLRGHLDAEAAAVRSEVG
ncbi:tellurite resistance TerB family protein [Donghicola sp. XS_ASV15]|uniref:tellurite resistance TerB family protein n=1 Tax=Donghicola sp. XS_ASV15 TaxID=3241295 RepID=UPI0035124563